MHQSLERLVSLLREELKAYGEMLALLEQQQEFVVARAADELLNTVRALQAVAAEIQNIRRAREQAQREAAREAHLSEESTLAELSPALPPDYRPLVQALVEENNALLFRVHQRGQQNHLLLTHSLDLMQRFLHALWPGCEPLVYNGAGLRQSTPPILHPIYQGLG